MTFRPIGTPQEHVRTALHLLDELDHQLRVLGLIGPQRYHLVRVLAAMRRQLWLAAAALESPRGTASWAWRRRFARKHGWSTIPGVAAVASVAGLVVLLVRSAWRSVWTVMRLARAMRLL